MPDLYAASSEDEGACSFYDEQGWFQYVSGPYDWGRGSLERLKQIKIVTPLVIRKRARAYSIALEKAFLTNTLNMIPHCVCCCWVLQSSFRVILRSLLS